ncbi:hypothetical protein CHARACLAT_020445 [Characodon lateralis]|uniref:Uncharacterized protein n=1 Tax=Characodon lateralis TaxID=208331 RepID=A0ABU7CQH8_9TELE|nr:hypothetical protein [Characodon lateralis]
MWRQQAAQADALSALKMVLLSCAKLISWGFHAGNRDVVTTQLEHHSGEENPTWTFIDSPPVGQREENS